MTDLKRRSLVAALGAAPLAVPLLTHAQTIEVNSKFKKVPSRERIRQRYFPNLELTSHEGRKLKLYDDLGEKESERLIVVLRLSPRRLPKPTRLFCDLRLRLLDHDGLLARGLWSSPSASHRTPAELLSLSVR